MFFIVGASGSGKTSVMNASRDMDIIFYDFDDIGVPQDADTRCRQESTEQWLKKIIATENEENTCLVGQMVLGEIVACPSFSKLSSTHVCFLDCNDWVRISRLEQRSHDLLTQGTLNWASWLRMHHQCPSWEPHVITQTNLLNFDIWKNSDNWSQFADIYRIDTSFMTVKEISNIVKEWIYQKQDKEDVYFEYAKQSDIEQIIALIKNDSLAQQRESKTDQMQDYERAFNKINQDSNATLLVCKKNHDVIGVTQINFIPNLTYQGGTRAMIEGVRIKEPHRGKGIGSKMINKAIDLARQRQCSLIQLTTDKLRSEALEFYKKLGFQDTHHGLKLKFTVEN